MYGQTFSLRDLYEFACQKKAFTLACLLLMMLAQLYFFYYPAGGYVVSDIVLLGNLEGQPFFDFGMVWERLFHDDDLMLKLLDEVGHMPQEDISKKIIYINSNIRNNLTYKKIQPYIIEMLFSQSTTTNQRAILTEFVDRIISEYDLQADRILKNKISKNDLTITKIFDDIVLLSKIFKGIDHQKIIEIFKDLSLDEVSIVDAKLKRFFSAIGLYLTNTERLTLRSLLLLKESLTSETEVIARMFGKKTKLLSNRLALPRHVQPYYKIVHLVVFLGFFLIWLAFLILSKHNLLGSTYL